MNKFKQSLAISLSLLLVLFPVSPSYAETVPPRETAKPVERTAQAPNAQNALKARTLFQKGTRAFQHNQSKRALRYFEKAKRLDPNNVTYLAAYEIARQQQVGGILRQSNSNAQAGNMAAAKRSLQEAIQLDPSNPFVREHLASLDTSDAVLASTPMPQFSSGLIELAPNLTRATFHLQDTAQHIVTQVLKAYGLTAILDDSVSKETERFDMTNATFAQASTALALTTHTFIVPLDGQHALVAADTRENRQKFQRLLLETVYLPGQDSKAMSDCVNLLRNVFGVLQVSEKADSGTLTIRAPEATLRAVNATLLQLYLPQPDVILDVRVYQIDNSRQETLGVSFPQTLSVFNVTSELNNLINANQSTVNELIASGLVNPGDLAGIAALLVGLGLANGTILAQPFALFGNGLTLSGLSFGTTTGNASLNISKTRELDHIQLRTGDLQKQSFLVGSRYPVITQSYSAGTQTPTSSANLAGLLSGTTQTNLSTTNPLSIAPTVQFIDLGLTMKATTHVLQGSDVRIQLQLKLSSLAGATVNGSPIIDNRSFTTAITVPNGGSALATSNLSRSESKSLSGIPGLSELPGFGWTASPTTQVTVGKLLIVISPHIVSATHPRTASPMLFLPQQVALRR